MKATYFRDVKDVQPPQDELLLTALASFVVGAAFAMVLVGAWLAAA